MDPVSVPVVAALILLHAVAIVIAWATRLATGSRLEGLSQLGFFAAMFGIGASALFFCQIEFGFSVPSGITLVAMVLTAVADFRPTQEPVGRLIR
jgi:hypothetical protein